jgi:transcriptional regulator with XRE-family HTH domain
MENRAIADRLKKARAFRGLSLRQTARRTGISVSTLNRYERGTVAASLPNAIKLAKAYNMNLDEIFTPTIVA